MKLLQIHEPGQTPGPHEPENRLVVGIDLGTTHSVVAVVRDGKPVPLAPEGGSPLLPSVVAWPEGADPDSGSLSALTGEPAREIARDHPDRAVVSGKRLLGRSAAELAPIAALFPWPIAPDPGDADRMVRLQVAGRSLTPVHVSAEILVALKQRAAALLAGPEEGDLPCRAVITVPAHFDDSQRTATRDAARLAGLEVLRLINEPTAAALAYGLDQGAEGLYLVFDLGGGTFDVSVLRLRGGIFQVLATGGDTALGGDDFDRAVVQHWIDARLAGQVPDARTRSRWMQHARTLREQLGDQTEAELRDGEETFHLERTALEERIAGLVDRMCDITQQTLADAGEADSADGDGSVEPEAVVLVGGATRTPLVRRQLAARLGMEPLTGIDPDLAVACGAALQADALTGGSDLLLLDVTPLSLGLETMGGLVEKLIHRNSPIPAVYAQEFTTARDGQTAILIHVLQGERETVDQCRSLGRFELRGIPKMVAGAPRIAVRFALDADGLLVVSARELTSGLEQRIEIRPSYGLDEEEMTRMLREAMENGRLDVAQRLLIEARVEADQVLGALDRALEADSGLLDAAGRTQIDQAAAALREARDGEDRDRIVALTEALDETSRPFAQARMDRAFSAALTGRTVEEIDRKLSPPDA